MTLLRGLLLSIVVFRTSAYIDPGSGSMLLQVLLGGVAGVAVLARLFWYGSPTYSESVEDVPRIPKTTTRVDVRLGELKL